MAKIRQSSLQGYVLEEALAYLVRNTGYSLITDPKHDPQVLGWEGNGLVVRGRGSAHQADVLGQLKWVPSFTFPIRLFVEAKFRKERTGLADVRSAVGVKLDVNQPPIVDSKTKIPTNVHRYEVAMFSTSGFTSGAQGMALAHQISLVELTGPLFNGVRGAIEVLSQQVVEAYRDEDDTRGSLVRNVRDTIRWHLGTGTRTPDRDLVEHPTFGTAFRDFFDEVRRQQHIFVGMPNSPFVLALVPDDAEAFLRHAYERPTHRVRITWIDEPDRRSEWLIEPVEYRAYRLRFRLPARLARFVFGSGEGVQQRAWGAKDALLSSISIMYRNTEGRDNVFRLQYDAHETADFLDIDLDEG